MSVMQAGVMPVHGESHWPQVVTQGQRSTVVGVRLFFSIRLLRIHCVAEALLKFFLRFAEIMKQTGECPMLICIEVA
jgi:hypothetical protein